MPVLSEINELRDGPGIAPGKIGGELQLENRAPDPSRSSDVKIAPGKWTDEVARAIVMADFAKFEQHRAQFDKRWTRNDEILQGNVDQKYWPNGVARSSVAVKLEEQQLESLLPYLYEGIFQSVDGIFFDTFPRPGTHPESARYTRELMAQQLDQCGAVNEICHSIRSLGHHGTGIIKVGWCRYQYDRADWVRGTVPEGYSMVNGQKVGYGSKVQSSRVPKTTYVNRPEVYFKNLRDIYVDSSLLLPNLQKSQAVIERALLGYDELKRIGEKDKTYKLPSEAELRQYLIQRKLPKTVSADSDRSRSMAAAGQTDIHIQGTTDPARARFEVLEYWTLDRFVVILERKWVICNKKNPYGFIPYFSGNFKDLLDSFYGKGLAETLEYEQMLQAGLINSHCDEVSLSIHSGLIVQTGSVLNKTQLSAGPGQVIEANSTDAVKELKRTPVTQDWTLALTQSQLRAQQITGLSDIITSGAPGVATSVTRTARGVSALAGGAMSRIQFLVERIENTIIVPMLRAIFTLNKLYLKPDEIVAIVGRDGLQYVFDPLLVANADVAFELRAASRMSSRVAMQQTLPQLLQDLGTMMGPLREQGVKTNIPAVIRDILEVNGWRNRNDWFTPMSQEEIQQMQQQEMAPQASKQQAQAERDQARFDANSQRQQHQAGLDILKDVVSKGLDGKPAAAAALGMALDASQAADA